MKKINRTPKELANLASTPKDSKDYLKFDEIKESLNGFARMVSYKSTNGSPDPQYCEIESVEEGEFKAGLKNGYCRSMSAIDGSCAAGYHKDGIPHGKWTSYKSNGEFALPQGLYEGSNCT